MYYLFKMRSDGNKNLSQIYFSWKLPITNVKFFLLFADSIFWAVPFYGQKVSNFLTAMKISRQPTWKCFPLILAYLNNFKRWKILERVGKRISMDSKSLLMSWMAEKRENWGKQNYSILSTKQFVDSKIYSLVTDCSF
jgi:hypothetical protein